MNAPGTPMRSSAIQSTMPCASPSTVVATMYRRTFEPYVTSEATTSGRAGYSCLSSVGTNAASMPMSRSIVKTMTRSENTPVRPPIRPPTNPSQRRRVEAREDVADLVGTDADRGEPGGDILPERGDLVAELLQQCPELAERDEHGVAQGERAAAARR